MLAYPVSWPTEERVVDLFDSVRVAQNAFGLALVHVALGKEEAVDTAKRHQISRLENCWFQHLSPIHICTTYGKKMVQATKLPLVPRSTKMGTSPIVKSSFA